MSPTILFDIDLKQKCSYIDLKGLIHIAGALHYAKIDDLYQILQLFKENQIIENNYTIDDIKDEISISRYIIYDESDRIIINGLVNDPSVLFSMISYIEKIKNI